MEEPIITSYLDARRISLAPLSLENTALIVIDMQENQLTTGDLLDYIRSQSPGMVDYLQREVSQKVIGNIKEISEKGREKQLPIFFTRICGESNDSVDFGTRVGRSDVPMMPSEHDPGAQIIAELTPQPNDVVINKQSSCALTTGNLDQQLRASGISQIILTGVATNMCVESTARTAFDLGYSCVVVDDACAAFSEATHQAALRIYAPKPAWQKAVLRPVPVHRG